MGVGRYLRSQSPQVRIYPLEPAESPTLSTGHKTGRHRIQGISDDFIPPICHLDELDDVVQANDGDAILMAQKLAHHGLAVGISSGANLIGALRVQDVLGRDAVVTTVFADSNKKYLSTDLLRHEPERADYLAPHVDVVGFDSFNRVCETCLQLR
jgi:cysteine synthase A